jgi:hypothetical protein
MSAVTKKIPFSFHATLRRARMIVSLLHDIFRLCIVATSCAEHCVVSLASAFAPQNVDKKKLLDSVANAQKMACG